MRPIGEPLVHELRSPDTGLGFVVMRALRTALVDKAEFVRLVDECLD